MKSISTQQLRIFLSSTFSDMQEERDALVKLFRELAEEGRRRGVDIKLVDLRWGVTDDQRRTGRVLSTCLQEIDNSRPYFIGLIGNRYGWIPSQEELNINPELCDKFPMIIDYASRRLSITEIEMRYGVLDKADKGNSLFFLKEGIIYENERHQALCKEVSSERVPHKFYTSVGDLVKYTKVALIQLIERFYPLLANIPEWERYERDAEYIAKSNRAGYIRYGDYMVRIDNWLSSDSQYLVVTGDSGCGKSSLIAEWLTREDFAGYKIMYHFVGDSLANGSVLEIQRHFLTRLEHEYELKPTPEIQGKSRDDDYLIPLEEALKEADRRGDKWLLIVDGLDHLEDVALTKMMIWFPELPPTSKALFSTVATDITYNRLCSALGYDELKIPALSQMFVREIVDNYLANVGKAIDSNLADMIATNSLFSNPYFLRLLLDELVTYGIHEEIASNVLNYTSSEDSIDFYVKLIGHAEDYYGLEKIEEILTLLAVVKEGLNEVAIIDILHWDPLDWSMIYPGISGMLTFTNGKYVISNPCVYEAIERRYDFEKNEYTPLIDFRRRILEYLEKNGEEIEEMAYQYFALEDYEKLYGLLISPLNIIRLIMGGDKLFASYWTAVIEETDHSLYDYLKVEFMDLPDWDSDEQLNFLIQVISSHFQDCNLSLKLREKANMILLSKGEDNDTTRILVAGNYALMAQDLLEMGRIEEGEKMLERAGSFTSNLSEDNDSFIFQMKGNFEFVKGNYETSLALRLRAIELEESAGDDVPWQYFNNAGLSYLELGRIEEAQKMFGKALSRIRQDFIDDTVEGATVFQNLGMTYLYSEEYDAAEEYFNTALEICGINLENPGNNVALLLNNLGTIYTRKDEPDKAMEYFSEACEILDRIAEMTPDHGLIYGNMGYAWEKKGDIEKAIEWFKKSIKTYVELVNYSHNVFSTVCMDLLNLYWETTMYEDMYETARTLIEWAEEKEESVNVVSAYSHYKLGDYCTSNYMMEEALCEYRIARDLFLLLGDKDGVEIAEEAIAGLIG